MIFFVCVYLESRCIWMFCGEFLWPVGPLQEMRCDMMWKKTVRNRRSATPPKKSLIKSNIEDESYNQIKGDKWVAGGALAMLLLWMICLCTCAFEAQNLRHLETRQPQCTTVAAVAHKLRWRPGPVFCKRKHRDLDEELPSDGSHRRFTPSQPAMGNPFSWGSQRRDRWVFHMTTVSSVSCLGLKQYWPLPNNWGCHNICA